MISTLNVIKLFVICAILSVITNFPSGFTNSSVNTAVEELRSFLNESYESRGWGLDETTYTFVRSTTLNCWFVSQVFGAIIAPILTDFYGRKIGYVISAVVMLIAACMQYIATLTRLPELLIAGRSLCALCSPLSDAALILYLQECSPLEMRGAFSFLGETGYGMMCLLGMILGMRSVLGDSLPKLLGVSIFPQVFFVVFLLFIPETPKFLMIIRNDRVGALKSLEFFQGVKKENERLLDEYMREASVEGDSKRSGVKGFLCLKRSIQSARSDFQEIFCTWHLRQAVILACMVLVQTLSFYPILQSSTYFFTEANIPDEIAEISSTIIMTLFALSCVLGTFFIDRFPRRILIFIFGFFANMFLLLFVICSVLSEYASWIKYACLACMGGYCVTFAMVLGPISWFVGPELVPQKHRSSVFCICYGINNILIAITNFSTIPLYEVIGAVTFVPLFIIPSFGALIYLYLYLPETRNRETHAIVASMRRKKLKDVESCSDIQPDLMKY